MPIGVLSNDGIKFSSKPILSQDAAMSRSALVKNPTFKSILEEKNKLIASDKHEKSLDFADTINVADRLN